MIVDKGCIAFTRVSLLDAEIVTNLFIILHKYGDFKTSGEFYIDLTKIRANREVKKSCTHTM